MTRDAGKATLFRDSLDHSGAGQGNQELHVLDDGCEEVLEGSTDTSFEHFDQQMCYGDYVTLITLEVSKVKDAISADSKFPRSSGW